MPVCGWLVQRFNFLIVNSIHSAAIQPVPEVCLPTLEAFTIPNGAKGLQVFFGETPGRVPTYWGPGVHIGLFIVIVRGPIPCIFIQVVHQAKE